MNPCPHPHPRCCLNCFDCPSCCTCKFRLPWDIIEKQLEKDLTTAKSDVPSIHATRANPHMPLTPGRASPARVATCPRFRLGVEGIGTTSRAAWRGASV